MFPIRAQIAPELLWEHITQVETAGHGLRSCRPTGRMAARVAGTGSVMTSVSDPSDSNRDAAEAKGSGPVARPQDVLRYGKTYALGGIIPRAVRVHGRADRTLRHWQVEPARLHLRREAPSSLKAMPRLGLLLILVLLTLQMLSGGSRGARACQKPSSSSAGRSHNTFVKPGQAILSIR